MRQWLWICPSEGNDEVFEPVVKVILYIRQAPAVRFIVKFVDRQEVSQASEIALNRFAFGVVEAGMTAELILKECQEFEKAFVPVYVSVLLCFPTQLLNGAE